MAIHLALKRKDKKKQFYIKNLSLNERFFYFYPIMNESMNELYEVFLNSSGITTDTRKIEPNQLFFALKGTNFNGNSYAIKALEQGAIAVVIDEIHEDAISENSKQIFLVADVLLTLQELAEKHRTNYKGIVIALTGSNGKTTTKELLNSVLSSRFNTLCTYGNLNNHIGVPLTLLNLRNSHEIAIIEMGANHQHEIESYCKWVHPDIGIITNIGKAHLEGFGGIEGVIKGKTELYRYIQSHGGMLWVNSDDALLVEKSKNIPHQYYGVKNEFFELLEINFQEEYLNFEILSEGINYAVKTQLTGVYNLSNILLAIYAGMYFKIPMSKILASLSKYTPTNSRSQIIKGTDYTIILDAYNANPSSMEVAIQNLATFNPETIAYLGAMKELGAATTKEHQTIGKILQSSGIKEVILVGEEFLETAKEFNYIFFESSDAAKEHFRNLDKSGKTILIKGSRGSVMEKIL